MNREIKFRAWNGSKMCDLYKLTPLAKDPSLKTDGLFIPFDPMYQVMQYTGLKDAKGVEIYEGDIVSDKCPEHIGVMEFFRGTFAVRSEAFTVCFSNQWEVIGNVFENPELLNVESSTTAPTTTETKEDNPRADITQTAGNGEGL